MKILIVGGAGYGGSTLAQALLEREHRIKVIDIVAPNYADNLREQIEGQRIEYVWKAAQDLTPRDVDGYEVVCAFNAQADVPMCFGSPRRTIEENVLGVLSVLEAVREAGCEKFCLPSSGNIFGRPPKIPIDEASPPVSHNVYSASKAAQESLAWAYYRSYGVPVIIYRHGIVYGGRAMRKNIFIYIWLKNILEDKPIVIEGGEQTRDPCYYTDTTEAWILGIEAAKEKVVGKIFQVSKGEEWKVQDIAFECMKAANKDVPIIYAPYRPGEEGMREAFDISKARSVLGYAPKVSMPEGLEMMVASMKRDFARDRIGG